jgi:hypothetical protein
MRESVGSLADTSVKEAKKAEGYLAIISERLDFLFHRVDQVANII